MCLKTCDLKVWKNLPAKKCIMKLVGRGKSIVINTHKNQIVSCLFLDPLIQPDHSCSSIGTLPNLLDDSMEKNPWDDTLPTLLRSQRKGYGGFFEVSHESG